MLLGGLGVVVICRSRHKQTTKRQEQTIECRILGAGGGRGDLPRASLSGPGDHLGWNVVQLSSGSEISRVTPVTGLLAGKGIYFHIGHVI